ncbi:hypothetical protein DFH09DRAFT_266708 [Mycena vulgaris]|nr:hypothetical protein DFH09DRAFT_266708 [Mycena vulgaris]
MILRRTTVGPGSGTGPPRLSLAYVLFTTHFLLTIISSAIDVGLRQGTDAQHNRGRQRPLRPSAGCLAGKPPSPHVWRLLLDEKGFTFFIDRHDTGRRSRVSRVCHMAGGRRDKNLAHALPPCRDLSLHNPDLQRLRASFAEGIPRRGASFPFG